MWTSKLGNVGKPLYLGLTVSGVLVNFGSLAGPGGAGVPQLRMRLPWEDAAAALSFDVTAYVDPNTPAQYNAQVIFDDFTGVVAGVYLAEVDASIAGNDITFPDDEYLLLRFLAGVD